MPASSPPASVTAVAPPQGLGAPRLRSSCDGCGDAKVKCDRVTPECGRCETLGLGCVYGPSRKFGKPPRKRLSAQLETTREKRICAQRPAECRSGNTTTDFGNPQDLDKSSAPDFSDPVADNTPPFPCGGSLNTAVGIMEQDELRLDFYPVLPFEEWTQLGGMGAGLDIPSTSALAAIDATSPSSGTHNCPRESYEIFRDLICPSPSLHAPDSNSFTVSAQLDQVLHFNRDAVKRLGRLLKCHCARSGHRAMVHASIISRVLIWYQQAAGLNDSNTSRLRPSVLRSPICHRVSSSSRSSSLQPSLPGTASMETTSPPTLAQATGFIVEQVPVSVGTFNIEDQDLQVAFRNQLILSELKKTATLIDIFTSQDSGESFTGDMAGLYSHLGAWLRREHSRTVGILRSGLDVLNET